MGEQAWEEQSGCSLWALQFKRSGRADSPGGCCPAELVGSPHAARPTQPAGSPALTVQHFLQVHGVGLRGGRSQEEGRGRELAACGAQASAAAAPWPARRLPAHVVQPLRVRHRVDGGARGGHVAGA